MRSTHNSSSVLSYVAVARPAVSLIWLLCLLVALPSWAQSKAVSFAGAQSTVPANGLYQLWAAAVDAQGNMYIANQGRYGGGSVVKLAAGTGIQTTLAYISGYPAQLYAERPPGNSSPLVISLSRRGYV
jgi:hypothetical protein